MKILPDDDIPNIYLLWNQKSVPNDQFHFYFSAKNVVDDKYILPNATYEIAMVHLIKGDLEKAKDVLKQAK